MERTQVSLTEEQMAGVRALARRRGISIAAVVRAAVDAELARDESGVAARLAREVVGAYRSGVPDLGREHDRYLGEDLAAGGDPGPPDAGPPDAGPPGPGHAGS